MAKRRSKFPVGQVVSWKGQIDQVYSRIVKITLDNCGNDLLHCGANDFLIHPSEVRALTSREIGPSRKRRGK